MILYRSIGDHATGDEAREGDFAAVLTKPARKSQLLNAIRKVLGEPQPTAQSVPPEETDLSQSLGLKILLAEDNEANIQTVGGYLKDKGCAMHYARNGVLAVKLARELHPALILMDIQMPIMDGLTAILEIRADAALKDIPIVALTALAMPGDRERCLAAGATDYMSKPVSLKALAALVERLVPRPDDAK